MNKKAQFQPIIIFVNVAIAVFFWASGLASQINYWTQRVIVAENITGLTAFSLAYMNLWILLGLFIVTSIGANMLQGGE